MDEKAQSELGMFHSYTQLALEVDSLRNIRVGVAVIQVAHNAIVGCPVDLLSTAIAGP